MMLGRAMVTLISMVLVWSGLHVAFAHPEIINAERFAGVVLVLLGGGLFIQMVRVAKKEDRNVSR